jgi:hypothetical protein
MLEWIRSTSHTERFSLACFRSLLVVAFLALNAAAHAASRVQAAAVPSEMRSDVFSGKVNGHPVDVAHAAANYGFVSFDVNGPVTVEVTAAEPGFWDKGVEIEPWRLGLRPTREGQTIRFKLDGPAKISISRPGDFLNMPACFFFLPALRRLTRRADRTYTLFPRECITEA